MQLFTLWRLSVRKRTALPSTTAFVEAVSQKALLATFRYRGKQPHKTSCGCAVFVQHRHTRYIVGVLLLSSIAVLRKTIERRPENDRHHLRAMPPADGLVASGSDKVLKTNLRGSDQHLSHVRISNVCAGRAPMAKSRLQRAFQS